MIRTNRGFRARRFRNRGFRPGVMIGLGLFFLFGGWIVIAVLGGLLGAGIMTAGAIVSHAVHLFTRLINGVFSNVFASGSVFLGVLLGLGLYYNRRKNARSEEAEEETESSFEENASREEDDAAIVTTHYMFH